MGAAAALLSSFAWALTSVLLTSQAGRMRPLVMSAVRSLTASVVLFGMLAATWGFGQFGEMSAATGLSMAGSGIMGQALGDTLYINALGFLGVSRTFPITNSAYPFLTFVFAVLLLGEDVTWTLPAGGALIVAGITWIVLEQRRADASDEIRVDLLRGLVFALAAALAWSLATVWLRGQQGDLDAVAAASLRIPAASVAVWGVIALSQRASAPALRPPAPSPRGVAIVSAAGVLGTGVGSVLFIYAVEHLGAARTAFLTTSAPVFALPMGVLFLAERVTPRVLLGTAITIAGIWLVLL
ncbi:MAG TPA: DMT family transporter [Vicinamibacterales bacterium]|nr:DMT family transporter [Vicinamibacterales bacterium]